MKPESSVLLFNVGNRDVQLRAEPTHIFCIAAKRLITHFCRTHLHVNPLKHSGHYMYHQFNIQQFYVLPAQCIYVFCVDLRTNSHYFPIQH